MAGVGCDGYVWATRRAGEFEGHGLCCGGAVASVGRWPDATCPLPGGASQGNYNGFWGLLFFSFLKN
jgi:hypothetical protein